MSRIVAVRIGDILHDHTFYTRLQCSILLTTHPLSDQITIKSIDNINTPQAKIRLVNRPI